MHWGEIKKGFAESQNVLAQASVSWMLRIEPSGFFWHVAAGTAGSIFYISLVHSLYIFSV
ncbi:hypothetical protein BBD42_19820 [Paenibacillus sp. BIHB 4019]|uniref:Uncharacterized protein n=1 Tax=Paenibacillus sp. BIHB 4019 TaxID=1870819 RepID=A0A1B2DL94_9BACL|nr:hypothetical protein BBD42_19820 [Paenibacillus sp. BIHB 4019]